MDLILGIFFVAVILFLVSSTIRRWVLMFILGRVQRRMMEQAEEMQRQQRAQQRAYSQTSREDDERPREKLDMDEIEAKRFERGNSDDYVDFEEIPK